MILALMVAALVAGVGIGLFFIGLFVGLSEPDEDQLIQEDMGRLPGEDE